MRRPAALVLGLSPLLLVAAGARALIQAPASPAAPSPPLTVLPTSVAGWLGIIGTFGLAVGAVLAWGRWVEHLNGLGKRVEKTEQAEERRMQQATDLVRMVERCADTQTSLVERVAEARKAAEACDDKARDHSLELGVKIDDLRKEVRTLADRMLVMETRADAGAPNRASGAQPRAD